MVSQWNPFRLTSLRDSKFYIEKHARGYRRHKMKRLLDNHGGKAFERMIQEVGNERVSIHLVM